MADLSIQVRVFDLFKKRALVTRESARAFQSVLQPLFREGKSEFVLDFAGVEAVTPSFVDELIGLVEESLSNKQQQQVRILFLHAPPRLSEKFAAVARA